MSGTLVTLLATRKPGHISLDAINPKLKIGIRHENITIENAVQIIKDLQAHSDVLFSPMCDYSALYDVQKGLTNAK